MNYLGLEEILVHPLVKCLPRRLLAIDMFLLENHMEEVVVQDKHLEGKIEVFTCLRQKELRNERLTSVLGM